jgi:hypothetical protein
MQLLLDECYRTDETTEDGNDALSERSRNVRRAVRLVWTRR